MKISKNWERPFYLVEYELFRMSVHVEKAIRQTMIEQFTLTGHFSLFAFNGFGDFLIAARRIRLWTKEKLSSISQRAFRWRYGGATRGC